MDIKFSNLNYINSIIKAAKEYAFHTKNINEIHFFNTVTNLFGDSTRVIPRYNLQ